MIALPGFYDSYSDAHADRIREQEKKRARERSQRIKMLKREIMFCKMRRKEYDRFLAELNELQREQLEELKKFTR